MRWALGHWWLIFPAWMAAAAVAGPLIGHALRRRAPSLPPLPRRMPPALPVDGEPLSARELMELIQACQSYCAADAPDPMERP